MKQSKYSIHVANPCSQNWDEMISDKTGRFCTQCAKSVIDFEHMTDAEILKFISQSSGGLCGRFNANQLNRELIPLHHNTHSRFQKIVAAFLLIAGSGISSAKAQQAANKTDISIHANSYSTTEPRTIIGKTFVPRNFIWGQVLDSASKLPLLGAVILIKNQRSGVITDSSGKFKLNIPDSLLHDSIILTISYVGYSDKEYIVNKTELGIKQEFKLVPEPQIILGGAFFLGEIRTTKESRLHRFLRKLF